MVFDKLKSLVGSGVTIDTVLPSGGVKPGENLVGEVRFQGGDVDQDVNGIVLHYTAVVTEEADGKDKAENSEFFAANATGPFQLRAGTDHVVEFSTQVPWEAPLSTIDGRPMAGMKLGVATELDLKLALDKGDVDPLQIDPLPVQQAVMSAIEELGFVYQESDLEPGTIEGSHLAFHQEIIFWAKGDYADRFQQLELSFIAGPEETVVIFQIGNDAGLVDPDQSSVLRFTLSNEEADVAGPVEENLNQLIQRKGL
ncbi:sporulation protein [Salininema proteolyticum]|uniref:Sporulation protein n=1 Tax=Salininema proteolyticum TaxID=1607685 RepID=A0ABV8TS87_9ACTN